MAGSSPESPNARQVFVIHGRDSGARQSIFALLRALDLEPIEFSQAIGLTGKGSPSIAEVLDAALSAAQAIVVLLTPDDSAHLKSNFVTPRDPDYERFPTGQARPNVLFEAGLAMGRNEVRTILVEVGRLRPFSDIAGRHVVRMSNNAENRVDLANRLRIAGCAVKTDGHDWLTAGDFSTLGPMPASEAEGPEDDTDTGVRVDVRANGKNRYVGRITTNGTPTAVIRSVVVDPADAFVMLSRLDLPRVLEAATPLEIHVAQIGDHDFAPKIHVET